MELQAMLPQGNKPKFYDIPTGPILTKYAPQGIISLTENERNAVYDQAANDIVKLVRDGTIWFPYQKYFREDPAQLFENLKHLDLEIRTSPYRLHSYYPKYGSYLPPRFRGQPITVAGSRLTYEQGDVLSDHFIEDVRMRAKRYDQLRSIQECWEIDDCLKEIVKTALTKEVITPPTLRDAIYETIAETKIFNPTWGIALLKLVLLPPNGKTSDLAGFKWLDISAGWGDRLLTAMTLGMEYTGFDPNMELTKGHSEMIARFGNSAHHRVIYEPFETGTIPDGPYDVVLSSPPYFNLEDYAPGQVGQSIVSYPDFTLWMVKFLFVSLEKAWANLKDNGYLILHLGDAKTIATSEAANIFIENYLPGSSWEGIIGLQGEAGYPRPVWVWKKVSRNTRRVLWEPQAGKPFGNGPLTSDKRTLYYMYPDLHVELIRNYASKYAPYYSTRLSSSQAVRAHIALRLPNIPSHKIEELLNDNLMISSLLEVKHTDDTISILEKLVSSYPNTSSHQIRNAVSELAPYYSIRINNGNNIRGHIASQLPNVSKTVISNILKDDLIFSSLVEILGVERTIIWGVAMIKLSLHI